MTDGTLPPETLFGSHERWMREALAEADKAEAVGEVPIGCVVVHSASIIGRGHNQTETLQDPTAHAEMIAISAAAASLGSRRLEDCALYVTLEPCVMCAGAIVLARIPLVVFGAMDPKAGASGSLFRILEDERLNHRCQVISGVMADEASQRLSNFFKKLRQAEEGNRLNS
ncbi:MAG: tRNA adenosine(34) deaminase TadA [bacterium]